MCIDFDHPAFASGVKLDLFANLVSRQYKLEGVTRSPMSPRVRLSPRHGSAHLLEGTAEGSDDGEQFRTTVMIGE